VQAVTKIAKLVLALLLCSGIAGAQQITVTTAAKSENLTTADSLSSSVGLHVVAVESVQAADFVALSAPTPPRAELLSEKILSSDLLSAIVAGCGPLENLTTSDAVVAYTGLPPIFQTLFGFVSEREIAQDTVLATATLASIPTSLKIVSVTLYCPAPGNFDYVVATWQDAPANGTQWWAVFDLKGAALARGSVSASATGNYSVASPAFAAPLTNTAMFQVCDKTSCKSSAYVSPK